MGERALESGWGDEEDVERSGRGDGVGRYV